MKNYRVMLDISNIYVHIRHLNLKGYNSPFPTVFITATDPDMVCVDVINGLIKILLDQDPSINMRIICRKIRKQSRIDKIYSL
jgi:hypothetical protein